MRKIVSCPNFTTVSRNNNINISCKAMGIEYISIVNQPIQNVAICSMEFSKSVDDLFIPTKSENNIEYLYCIMNPAEKVEPDQITSGINESKWPERKFHERILRRRRYLARIDTKT